MATFTRKQEMPPEGGFKSLDYSRVAARSIIGAKTLIVGHFVLTFGSLYLYSLNYKKVEMHEIEKRSSMMAIKPMLLAERDRAYLKQLRRNRDEEASLMANVEGWEVGTFNGERIYKTLPPDTFMKPGIIEYFVHGSSKAFTDFFDILLWV